MSLAVYKAQTPQSCLKHRLKPLETSSTTGQNTPYIISFFGLSVKIKVVMNLAVAGHKADGKLK